MIRSRFGLGLRLGDTMSFVDIKATRLNRTKGKNDPLTYLNNLSNCLL